MENWNELAHLQLLLFASGTLWAEEVLASEKLLSNLPCFVVLKFLFNNWHPSEVFYFHPAHQVLCSKLFIQKYLQQRMRCY